MVGFISLGDFSDVSFVILQDFKDGPFFITRLNGGLVLFHYEISTFFFSVRSFQRRSVLFSYEGLDSRFCSFKRFQ